MIAIKESDTLSTTRIKQAYLKAGSRARHFWMLQTAILTDGLFTFGNSLICCLDLLQLRPIEIAFLSPLHATIRHVTNIAVNRDNNIAQKYTVPQCKTLFLTTDPKTMKPGNRTSTYLGTAIMG